MVKVTALASNTGGYAELILISPESTMIWLWAHQRIILPNLSLSKFANI